MSDAVIYLGALLIGIGIIVLLADVAHPGLFLLVPAAVLMAIGFLFLVAPGLFTTDPLAATMVVLAAGSGGAVVAITVYQKLAPTQPPIASTMDTLSGMRGKVTVPVTPGTMKGKVRVRGEIWSATSDVTIPEGEEVVISGGEGIILKVKPASSNPMVGS